MRPGLAVTAALVLAACAMPLYTSPGELSRGDPAGGTIIGSVRIQGGKEVTITGRHAWSLELSRVEDVRHPRELNAMLPLGVPARSYTVKAYRDGAEELFVARLPPGRYAFWRLSRPDAPTFTQGTEVYLTVPAGTVSYVGRLVVEFPPGLISSTAPDRFGCTGLKFSLRVEDANVPDLEKARASYDLGTGAVASSLMTLEAPAFCGHEYDAGGRLP